MAKQLGEKNPLGARLPVNDGEPPLEVIGVVKDFHFQSLHSTISPLTLSIQPGWPMYYLLVKVSPDNLPATMETIKRAWAEVAPNTAFNASFLNENDDRQYKGEERLSKIFIAAAGLAILISCMGLFAMAVLVMAQRTKEIGIRKVLGASVPHLVGLLSGEFLKLVGIAIVVRRAGGLVRHEPMAAKLPLRHRDRRVDTPAGRGHCRGRRPVDRQPPGPQSRPGQPGGFIAFGVRIRIYRIKG
jgi:hypothetical protein